MYSPLLGRNAPASWQMWQQCPICSGSGYQWHGAAASPCPTCKGHRIISTLTGRPPEGAP